MPAMETRSGRPRDPSRDEVIRNATLDLLSEVGYEKVTVRAIAERAGVGLATMYRRWPTKEALVVEAVASFDDPIRKLRPGDDPVANLRRLATAFLDIVQGPRGGLITNLIGQLPHNPELAEAMRTQIMRPRLAAAIEQVRSLPDANPDRVQDAAELLAASIIFRTQLLGRHLTRRDVERLIDTIIACATAPS